MKTVRPYCQIAYCPEPGCWFRFPIISIFGFDEEKKIKCPQCSAGECRLEFGGEYNGDQLRELYKAVDKARDERKAKEEAGDDDDKDTPNDKKRGSGPEND